MFSLLFKLLQMIQSELVYVQAKFLESYCEWIWVRFWNEIRKDMFGLPDGSLCGQVN